MKKFLALLLILGSLSLPASAQTTRGLSLTENGTVAAPADFFDINAGEISSALDLGTSATLDVGTTTGTVAAGDDSRITGAVQSTGNYTNPDWLSGLSWSKISSTPTTLSGYGISDAQPLSTSLTNVAALSGTGLAARTGNGTWSTRTLTGTSGQITVTNGDGVSGNPTLTLPATITGNKTLDGNTTVGTASGQSLTINAGTVTAPNASAVGANNLTRTGILDERFATGFSITAVVPMGSVGDYVEFASFPQSLTDARAIRVSITNSGVRTQALYDIIFFGQSYSSGEWRNLVPVQIGCQFPSNSRYGLQVRRDGSTSFLRIQRLYGTEGMVFTIRIVGARRDEFTIGSTTGSDSVITDWLGATTISAGGSISPDAGLWVPPGSPTHPGLRFLNASAVDLSNPAGFFGNENGVGVVRGFLQATKTISSGTTINLSVQNNVRLAHGSDTTITGFSNGVENQQTNLINAGSATITIQNNANVMVRGGGDLVLPPGGGCTVYHRSGTTFSVW